MRSGAGIAGGCVAVAACLLAFAGGPASAPTPPSKVLVVEHGNGHRLVRDGRPYFVRGVGGHTRLAEASAAGANSIRTWGAEGLEGILDEAHKHGLTVTAGLWLGHQRHGFDYHNRAMVAEQLERCLEVVRRSKDHPALLMWGIGNEMEGDGRDPAVWRAVDQVAREVKRLDPNHPTMTVIAELGKDKLQSVERFCPHVDIIGVNSYGGLPTLGTRYRAAGGGRPYIVTELGPPGPWEATRTPWGSPIEMTSTEKAVWYADGYRQAVTEQAGRCLGSYAFYWGYKQETTATWFGLLLPDGSRLGAVDALTEAWTGVPPANSCPKILALKVEPSATAAPGQTLTARLSASDPDGDPMSFAWILRTDSGTIGVGGDAQREEAPIDTVVAASGPRAKLAMPATAGAYRLFVSVHDGHGGAAVANVPLLVENPAAADQKTPSRSP